MQLMAARKKRMTNNTHDKLKEEHDKLREEHDLYQAELIYQRHRYSRLKEACDQYQLELVFKRYRYWSVAAFTAVYVVSFCIHCPTPEYILAGCGLLYAFWMYRS